jgi:hypothetical protein
MARAGYDPEAAVQLWRNMDELSGAGRPAFCLPIPPVGSASPTCGRRWRLRRRCIARRSSRVADPAVPALDWLLMAIHARRRLGALEPAPLIKLGIEIGIPLAGRL